jgi:hypothetical protein
MRSAAPWEAGERQDSLLSVPGTCPQGGRTVRKALRDLLFYTGSSCYAHEAGCWTSSFTGRCSDVRTARLICRYFRAVARRGAALGGRREVLFCIRSDNRSSFLQVFQAL